MHLSAILGVSCLSKEALTIKTRVVSVLGKDRNHENFVSMTHESSGYIYIYGYPCISKTLDTCHYRDMFFLVLLDLRTNHKTSR